MILNGEWKLYYFVDSSIDIESTADLDAKKIPSIPCMVPGNVELDLSRAGILPEDLFKGMRVKETWKYGAYEWWYTRDFVPEVPREGQRVILHFHAVDTVADYYVNGVKIGHSENMFIDQKFDVTDLLRYGESNTLHVNIKSSLKYIDEQRVEPVEYVRGRWGNCMHVLRRADHMLGWDIMPRTGAGGIWRDVELDYVESCHFYYTYFSVVEVGVSETECEMIYSARVPLEDACMLHNMVVRGRCRDYEFTQNALCSDASGSIRFKIPNEYLWWPRNYGIPNLFDLTVEFYSAKGELLFAKQCRQGFRKAELYNSGLVEPGGKFEFRINNKKIIAMGSNWVPMDPYHSRDRERYAWALALADEIGCNILRCWGGGVYEDDAFYEFCDEHGIMVWQDFMVACGLRPMRDDFLKSMEEELISVIEKLRNYACIVLWCGDNEVDACNRAYIDPKGNKLSRRVMPEIIYRLDPRRPYLPSSPYYPDRPDRESLTDRLAERHLWGSTDYKSPFYSEVKAYFVSEVGTHGCPSVKSIEKFIDPEKIWPYFNNEQWNFHSTDIRNSAYRTMRMHRQIEFLFGTVPDTLEAFAEASQIVQAEAYKFFIERIVRARTGETGGIIWWNLIDGWPQFSDAVVDYYYEKKLAYDYIRRSMKPVLALVGELTRPWGAYPVLLSNCGSGTKTVQVKVTDVETGRLMFEGERTVESNQVVTLGEVDIRHAQQGMLQIEYVVDGEKAWNTYLYGRPAFSLSDYKKWMNSVLAAEAD